MGSISNSTGPSAPKPNFDVGASFERSAMAQQRLEKMADEAGNVGFFGRVGDFFVPSRAEKREHKMESLRNASQLINQIREAMVRAVEQMSRG